MNHGLLKTIDVNCYINGQPQFNRILNGKFTNNAYPHCGNEQSKLKVSKLTIFNCESKCTTPAIHTKRKINCLSYFSGLCKLYFRFN